MENFFVSENTIFTYNFQIVVLKVYQKRVTPKILGVIMSKVKVMTNFYEFLQKLNFLCATIHL